MQSVMARIRELGFFHTSPTYHSLNAYFPCIRFNLSSGPLNASAIAEVFPTIQIARSTFARSPPEMTIGIW
jgi:hypothetical protein